LLFKLLDRNGLWFSEQIDCKKILRPMMDGCSNLLGKAAFQERSGCVWSKLLALAEILLPNLKANCLLPKGQVVKRRRGNAIPVAPFLASAGLATSAFIWLSSN
jgi:hypothetical protein